MLPIWLSLAIAASAFATIVAHYPQRFKSFAPHPPAAYFFKPLTTVLTIALAWVLAGADFSALASYQQLVLAGLVFSLAGDIFLMLPKDRFIAGLLSFLVAHLLYIAAFYGQSHSVSTWVWLPCLAWGGFLLHRLWPGLGALKGAVMVYAAALLGMGVAAGAQFEQLPGLATALAAAGAVLFIASDSLLALNRFKAPFFSAQAWVLATYFMAQLLIAWSV